MAVTEIQIFLWFAVQKSNRDQISFTCLWWNNCVLNSFPRHPFVSSDNHHNTYASIQGCGPSHCWAVRAVATIAITPVWAGFGPLVLAWASSNYRNQCWLGPLLQFWSPPLLFWAPLLQFLVPLIQFWAPQSCRGCNYSAYAGLCHVNNYHS